MATSNLDLLLLGILRAGPRHGYAVIGALRDRSGGAFDFAEGTVYPALHRLEQTGLVASQWTIVDGRKRRRYELTAQGLEALEDRRLSWTQYVQAVEGVIGA